MPVIAPAYTTINPHMMLPGVILPYYQASGAFELLADGDPRIMLGEEDLAIYVNRADIRTKMGSGQSSYNQLPSIDIVMSQNSTATYLMQVRAEFGHHDTAALARYNMGIDQAQTLGMQQAHFQLDRIALLYGMNPANGEGIVNATGTTSINLPADSNGNTTISTYDNGQLAFFLLQTILNIKTRTVQLGLGQDFTICGPQRDLGLMEYNVVQLVQFQRNGAGTASTAGTIKDVLAMNGDTIKWVYDDTLIGKGSGGHDLIIIDMPKVKKPEANRRFNTNKFAEVSPGIEATVDMFCDMAAPREIRTPLPGGAIDILSEMRVSSGWPLRPECVTLLSAQYV
jgi:hypothetical protein